MVAHLQILPFVHHVAGALEVGGGAKGLSWRISRDNIVVAAPSSSGLKDIPALRVWWWGGKDVLGDVEGHKDGGPLTAWSWGVTDHLRLNKLNKLNFLESL